MMERMPVPEPVQAIKDLRSQVLSLSPADIGLTQSEEHPNVWGVLMELGFPEGVATLVSLADGSTSLYLGHGGGTIGAGSHENVKRASCELLRTAERYIRALSPARSFPLPDIGRAVFYVLTFSGPLTAEIGQEEVFESEGHELLPLFVAGNAVLTEIGRLGNG
jgi:hypothetical protein